MPNGSTTTSESEREALRAFFVSHYDEIYRFAVDCNMTIERWPHNTDVWSLCFTPPQGGSASITIRPEGHRTFKLHTGWYIDNHDASTLSVTRSLKHWESPTYRENEASLTELLQRALRDMMNWREGEWSSVSTTPPGVQRFTREQWENMQARYPRVRPPGDAG
jgi:hypothetical protein